MNDQQNEYYRDIFFDLTEFSTDQIKELFSYCLDYADDAYVDVLDCSKSIFRKRSDILVETVMKSKAFDRAHHVFIYRRGYISRKDSLDSCNMGWRLEVGSRTMENPVDYFIYIIINETELDHIVNKFNLIPMI